MKRILFALVVVSSFSVHAKGDHQLDPVMRQCLSELKSSSGVSEQCQEYFDQRKERQERIKECIAQVDGSDSSDALPSTDTSGDEPADTSIDDSSTDDSSVDDSSAAVTLVSP
jgi:hypothetical protein